VGQTGRRRASATPDNSIDLKTTSESKSHVASREGGAASD
jgi:hypothetical protein